MGFIPVDQETSPSWNEPEEPGTKSTWWKRYYRNRECSGRRPLLPIPFHQHFGTRYLHGRPFHGWYKAPSRPNSAHRNAEQWHKDAVETFGKASPSPAVPLMSKGRRRRSGWCRGHRRHHQLYQHQQIPRNHVGSGILARKAVAKGLTPQTLGQKQFAPGSRVVTDYLAKTGLDKPLDQLGFQTVGYGCTTCIGNSGPLLLRFRKPSPREPHRCRGYSRAIEISRTHQSAGEGELSGQPTSLSPTPWRERPTSTSSRTRSATTRTASPSIERHLAVRSGSERGFGQRDGMPKCLSINTPMPRKALRNGKRSAARKAISSNGMKRAPMFRNLPSSRTCLRLPPRSNRFPEHGFWSRSEIR